MNNNNLGTALFLAAGAIWYLALRKKPAAPSKSALDWSWAAPEDRAEAKALYAKAMSSTDPRYIAELADGIGDAGGKEQERRLIARSASLL